jgi:PIN domain nuclease of toxin-antitoxin system
MQIKHQLGKLKLSLPLSEVIESQRKTNNIQVLPIVLTHVLALQNFPAHHNDPFDRLLIAQANVEGAVLLSSDSTFASYSVKSVW